MNNEVVLFRSGSALLLLLVVIAIGMMIYFLDISALFGPSQGGQSGGAESRPWLEEERILAADEIVEMPEAPKPEIGRKFTVAGAVTRGGESRGDIEITFGVDGRVRGMWACEYVHGERGYSYTATFAGNVDVDKVCEVEGKKDKTLLYFIAKGVYVQKSGRVGGGEMAGMQEGSIYVTGWLAGDHEAEGLITITTDRKWSAVYEWATN